MGFPIRTGEFQMTIFLYPTQLLGFLSFKSYTDLWGRHVHVKKNHSSQKSLVSMYFINVPHTKKTIQVQQTTNKKPTIIQTLVYNKN